MLKINRPRPPRHATTACAAAAALACAALTTPAPLGAQTFLGRNFTASTRGADSTLSPPDTCGAAGVDHFVELINGRYSVYRKSDGARVQTSTLDAFWAAAGAPHTGTFSFDPRVLYDPYARRWYALSADNPRGPNVFLFAVSNSADPTAGWSGFRIDADSDDTNWADFPTMGYNGDVVVVQANMFPITTGSNNSTFVVIPKSGLLGPGAPSVAGATRFEALTGTGFSVQPVVDMDNGSLPMAMLSNFNSTTIKRTNVTGTPASPTITTAGGFITVSANSPPPTADQPGPKANIHTGGDNRFSQNVVLNNGEIWAVQTVGIAGRAALRWYRINATTNAVIENGIINHPSLAYFFPSIAVNDFGDVVIGMSGTDPSTFVSTYAVAGKTIGGVTTFGAPFQTKAGVSDYERFDTSGRNRWGDYSATTTDPADPSIFWTIQEYVSATDQWSTQVTEIITPQPGEVRWKDPVDGDFDDPASWFGAAAPSATSHTIFSRATNPTGGAYAVTVNGPEKFHSRLSVRQGNVDLVLNTRYSLGALSQDDPSLTVGEFAGAPTLRLRGSGTLETVHVDVAPEPHSTGTLILAESVTLRSGIAQIHVGGSFVGHGGAGTLILAAGGSPALDAPFALLKVWERGVVRFDGGSLAVGHVNIQDGLMRLAPGGGKVVRCEDYTLIANGRLDLSDNGMIVDYSFSGTGLPELLETAGKVRSGHAGGTWDGPGFLTSSGDATSHGLGYGLSGALGITTFMGHPVDTTTLLIRYTRYGDADLNGVVNLIDFNVLAARFGSSALFWHQGDFNYDEVVNLADFNLLAANFGLSAGPDGVVDPSDWANLAAAVPEPALVPWLLGALPLRRRRRHRS